MRKKSIIVALIISLLFQPILMLVTIREAKASLSNPETYGYKVAAKLNSYKGVNPGDSSLVYLSNAIFGRFNISYGYVDGINAKVLVFSDITKSADNGYPLIADKDLDTWIDYFKGNKNFVKAHLDIYKADGTYTFYNWSQVAELSGGHVGPYEFRKVGDGYEMHFLNADPWAGSSVSLKMNGSSADSISIQKGEEVTFTLQGIDGSYYQAHKQLWNFNILAEGVYYASIYKNTPKDGKTVTETLSSRNFPVYQSTGNKAFDVPGIYIVQFYMTDGTDHGSPTVPAVVKQVIVQSPANEPFVNADFTINPNPVQVNTAFAFEDKSQVYNDKISKREWTMTIGSSQYKWTTDEKGNVTSGTRPSKADKSGTYPATLKVTTEKGLTSSATRELQVTDTPPAPPEPDNGIPPVADFDMVNPIWQGDPVQVTDKSSDEDGWIVFDGWGYTDPDGQSGVGLPTDTSKYGKWIIRRHVMDNDGNVDVTSKELTVLEKIKTTDLIPGSEYAYPTEDATPFPYEASNDSIETVDLSYLLPPNLDLSGYEVRMSGAKVVLFKKDDYRIWEIRNRQMVEVTPQNFYIPNDRKFVIKDIQLIGGKVLVAGYFLFWGHEGGWTGSHDWGVYYSGNGPQDDFRVSAGNLKRYNNDYFTTPNIVVQTIGYTNPNYEGWGYIGYDSYIGTADINVTIRNYSGARAAGNVTITIRDSQNSFTKTKYVDLLSQQTDVITLSNVKANGGMNVSISTNFAEKANDNNYGYALEVGKYKYGSYWNTYENGTLPRWYFPDHVEYYNDNYNDYEETGWQRYNASWGPVPYVTWYQGWSGIDYYFGEKTTIKIMQLDSNFNLLNQSDIKQTLETNNIQMRKIDNQKAIVVYDYVNPNTKLTSFDEDLHPGKLEAGIYNLNGSFSIKSTFGQTFYGEIEAIYGTFYNVVWEKKSGNGKSSFYTIQGPGYEYDAELLDFDYSGMEGYAIFNLSAVVYYSKDVERIGLNGGNRSDYDRNEITIRQIAHISYNPATDSITMEPFKEYGYTSDNWPHPYKYRERPIDPGNINQVIKNKNGVLSFSKGGSDIFDAKLSSDPGVYYVFKTMNYMVALGLGVPPSQISNIKYITGVESKGYSIFYLQNQANGKYYLLVYDGISIKGFKIPGMPDDAVIQQLDKVEWNGKTYALAIAKQGTKPIFIAFDLPDSLFNIPAYFSTNVNYYLPIGTHIYHNNFVDPADIQNKLKQNNMTVNIKKRKFDDTNWVPFDSYTFSPSSPTLLKTVSEDHHYDYLYRPFLSTEDSEYQVEVNVNPLRTILEQDFLKQPLYDNNTGKSSFITIGVKKPVLTMSKTRLYTDRSQAEGTSDINYTIYNSYAMTKYYIVMRNKATGEIEYLRQANDTVRSIIFDARGRALGNYEMYIEVVTKYNLVLRSDPVSFSIVKSSPPVAEVTYPSSPDQNNPTIYYGSNPTITWSYYDPDGDPQRMAVIMITGLNGQINGETKQWTVPKALNDGIYKVQVQPYDQYSAGSWSAPKYLRIINNRPPVAGFTVTPSIIWENDTVTITSTATDPDGDPLTYLYEVTDPRGGKQTYTVANPSFKVPYVGTWTVKQTVTDSKGASASLTKTFFVGALTVTGAVKHTAQWDQNRQKWNAENDPDRPYNVFWAGEKFLLEATTTDTGASSTKASQVEVVLKQTGTRRTLISKNTSKTFWEGEMWQDTFDTLQDGTYTFEFTATYTNGTVEKTIVSIEIKGSVYDILGTHRKH